jgi:tetratricopeptide (TPR) repeat protein
MKTSSNIIQKTKKAVALIISLSTTKLKKILFFSLLFFILFIYSYSTARYNTSYADSDEIITAGYHLSVAHPPGYPLSAVLTRLFILLPLGGSVAFRANLLNAVIHSLTIAFLFLSSLEIIPSFSDKKKNHLFIAFFGSLTLAFSSLFWLYSSITEVAPIGNLFTILTLLFAFRWRNQILSKKPKSLHLAYLTCLFWGIGLSHLQTLILLAPALFLIFFLTLFETKSIKKYSIYLPFLIVVVLASFFLPNLILLFLNARQNDTTWWFSQDFSGWFGHIMRKAYGGYYIETEHVTNPYFNPNRNLAFYLRRFTNTLPFYIKYLTQHFSVFPLFLLFLAFVDTFKTNKKTFFILLITFIIPAFLFPLYLSAPEVSDDLINIRMQTGINQRQYLIGETIIGLIIILGLNSFIDFLSEYINQKNLKKYIVLLYLPFLIFLFRRNFTMGVKRNFDIAYKWGITTLNQLEPDSVIICASDFSCYTLLYINEVELVRPDVTVLTKNSFYRKNFLIKNPDYVGYYYPENPYFLASLISWNVSKRPTYITDLSNFYLDFIGLEGDPFFLIPNGYSMKIDYKMPDKIPHFDYFVSEDLLSYPTSKHNYWQLGLGDYFANHHMLVGTLYANLRMQSLAKYHYDLAVALTHNQYQKPKDLLTELEYYQGNENYQLGKEGSSSGQLYVSSLAFLDQGLPQKAYEQMRRALYGDPLNFEIRLKLANLYKENGFFEIAKLEFENVLMYHPQNQEALAGFQAIEAIEN